MEKPELDCVYEGLDSQMQDPEQDEMRIKSMRQEPYDQVGALKGLLAGQVWIWHWAGILLALVLAIVIAGLTLSPLPQGSTLTGGIDKVYHAIAFSALIFPLILTDSRRWIWAVPLTIAYGGMIELIQPSVGRTAEWLDFFADITGVLAGAALAELLHDRIRDNFFAVAVDAVRDASAVDDAPRIEAMRAELMDELRAVLRDELASITAVHPVQAPVEEPVKAPLADPPANAGPAVH